MPLPRVCLYKHTELKQEAKATEGLFRPRCCTYYSSSGEKSYSDTVLIREGAGGKYIGHTYTKGERRRPRVHLDLKLSKTLDTYLRLPSKPLSQRRDGGKSCACSSTMPYASGIHDDTFIVYSIMDHTFPFKVFLEGFFSILRNYVTLRRGGPPRSLMTGPEKNLVLHCSLLPTYKDTQSSRGWAPVALCCSAP